MSYIILKVKENSELHRQIESYIKANKEPKQLAHTHCLHCGKELKKKRKNTRFCNKVCYAKHAYKSRPEVSKTSQSKVIQCYYCGQEFTTHHYLTKYCSESCRKRATVILKHELYVKHRDLKNTVKTAAKKRRLEDDKPAPRKNNGLGSKKIKALNNFMIDTPVVIKPDAHAHKTIPVRIDSRTTIFIAPGQDPEEARTKYLLKHKM